MGKILEMVRVTLTPEELTQKGAELVACMQAAAKFEGERCALIAKARECAKLAKEQRERADELARVLSAGTAIAEVACEERPRWDEDRVEIVDPQTGEVLRIRPLASTDRQLHLEDAR